MTAAIRLVALALLVSIGFLVQFVRTERYRTTVLVEPVTLADSAPQAFPFDVDRAHAYLVEVWLDTLLPVPVEEGDEAPPLDVRWRVLDGETVVGRGSGEEYGPATVTTRRRRGRIIGEIPLEPGPRYTLVLEVVGGDDRWERANPQVDVIVHPAIYETRLFRQARLLMLCIVLGAALTILLVWRSRRRAGTTSPDAPPAVNRT